MAALSFNLLMLLFVSDHSFKNKNVFLHFSLTCGL